MHAREARRQSTPIDSFVGESDTWHHKATFTEIVHRPHAAGLAGASVFRGIEGYGASNLIHTTWLLSLSARPDT